jgi:hypothetical protein
VSASIKAFLLAALLVGGEALLYQQSGPAGPQGVGDRWYEGVPNHHVPDFALPPGFQLAVDAERGGTAQDVAGVYALNYNAASRTWTGGSGASQVTVRKVDAVYVLQFAVNGVLWGGNGVLATDASTRTVYWRVGGPTGTVRCMARY